MKRQLELLPPRGLDITPAKGIDAPRLWVQRLVVWENPGVIVRDIALRPGLNIVWSPDSAEAGAAGTPAGGALGHGSGKTLLCRLLRYRLGENRFAPDGQRQIIADAFLEGLAGPRSCWTGRSGPSSAPSGTGGVTCLSRGATWTPSRPERSPPLASTPSSTPSRSA